MMGFGFALGSGIFRCSMRVSLVDSGRIVTVLARMVRQDGGHHLFS